MFLSRKPNVTAPKGGNKETVSSKTGEVQPLWIEKSSHRGLGQPRNEYLVGGLEHGLYFSIYWE
jgi:hypothetical protein